jgi:uncharacterized protein YciI
MLFVWLGFLNESAEPDQQVQEQVTGFLQQPLITIRAAGALRDGDSKRAGMMMVFEAENRAAAEALVSNSPILQAGLYREHHLYEYQNEVG